MILILLSGISFSQGTEATAKTTTKNSQATLYNDVYAGYGALSVYYFTGNFNHTFNLSYSSNQSDPQSVGSFFIGYARSLNKVVSTGFMFGYQNFQTKGNGHVGSTGSIVPVTVNDNLIMGMARVTFCYLNKPYIRMYSGVGIGLTIDFGKATVNGEQTTERKLWPGGELTLMGLRVGSAFGGFLEFGFGSYGIVLLF